jgi:hypothetical protein
MSCHPEELGICPKTVETYDEHIKIKLGYADAEALHRGYCRAQIQTFYCEQVSTETVTLFRSIDSLTEQIGTEYY